MKYSNSIYDNIIDSEVKILEKKKSEKLKCSKLNISVSKKVYFSPRKEVRREKMIVREL
jgi:hypothetical protein